MGTVMVFRGGFEHALITNTADNVLQYHKIVYQAELETINMLVLYFNS